VYAIPDIEVLLAPPWDISFVERLSSLRRAKINKRNIAVYIYEKADTSTFRYRVYNMCQTLLSSEQWFGVFFFERELPFLVEHISLISVVVIVRTRWSEIIELFMIEARKRRIKLIFDIDDLVFDINSIPLIVNTLNVDMRNPDSYSYWFSYVSRLYLTGARCDALIGTNEYLSNELSQCYSKPAAVINNFLNEEQCQISNQINSVKCGGTSERPFVIGYFSGTPSHTNDFRLIAPEILELLNDYSDIKLKIIGFIELPEFLCNFLNSGRIIHESLVDFLTLQKKVAEVDVNIVPLLINRFTNAKSELKYFEASIVSTITCASPSYSYAGSFRHAVTCFLC